MAVKFIEASNVTLNLGTDIPALNNVSGATIMLWAKRSGLNGGATSRLFSISVGPPPGTSATARFSIGITTTGLIRVQVAALDADTGGAVSGSAIPDQTWTHMAATVDYTTRTVTPYVNGIGDPATVVAGTTAGNTSATNAKCGRIGSVSDGSAGFYGGLIEDARLYNRILGADEIKTIFTSKGKDGIWYGCQMRFPMNELSTGKLVVLASNVGSVPFSGTPSNSPAYDDGVTVSRARNIHRPRFMA